jgi:hypothetical protein
MRTQLSPMVSRRICRPSTSGFGDREGLETIQNAVPYSSQFIKVTLKKGWPNIGGNMEWNYQPAEPHRAWGAIGVTNEAASRGGRYQAQDRRCLEVQRGARRRQHYCRHRRLRGDAKQAPSGLGPSARKRNGQLCRLPALRQWKTNSPSALESWTNGVRADHRYERQ